jgi:hypothetical protein
MPSFWSASNDIIFNPSNHSAFSFPNVHILYLYRISYSQVDVAISALSIVLPQGIKSQD